ncbi:MAG: hypothetical protein HYV28_14495 [Ignavibacteriales bacterium]|nr:hypothetical protein [Ignavibacteriales bacterium]
MLLQTTEAQKVYERYINRLKRSVSSLPDEMQQDIRNEISNHIFDSMESSKKDTELDRLLDAIDRLGDPEVFLKPMIADYQVEYATATFKPLDVFRAIIENLGAGFARSLKFSVFGILYLTLFTFAILFVCKIFLPHNTGLFYSENGFQAFGIIAGTKGANEVLGYWLMPIAMAGCVLDYLLITLIMKITAKRRR